MTLYNVIKQLHDAKGTIEKQSILEANKDNELLRNFVKATLDPAINYYMAKLPKVEVSGTYDFSQGILNTLTGDIATRDISGDYAKRYITGIAIDLTTDAQELLSMVVSRKLGKTGVGETAALKTWPGLFFTVPYQRCSLLDKKARERFGKLKRFFVQTKADGSFAYVVKRLDGTVDVITRQGSKYPQWFAEYLAKDVPAGSVIVGELLVDEKLPGIGCQALDRKTANGLLNSALKDGEKFDLFRYGIRMQAWDMLTQAEFEAGKSDECMINRYARLDVFLGESPACITSVGHWEVSSLEEAFAIYQDHLQQGLEGCIIKDPDSLWKDGTAKDMVKLKIKFEVEMRCSGVYEGEGKAENKLGGVYIKSEDGGIECACGSGFSDDQRSVYWSAPDLIIGRVIAVEANDITQSRDERKKPALSLPIFIEVRDDKTLADTTERIYAQLEAAKQGS